MKKLFTKWEPDPAGLMLGTGFMRFETKVGIDGLVLECGDRIDLLAVIATNDNGGNLKRFFTELKARYNVIRVLCIMNPAVEAALKRYGSFRTCRDIGYDGSTVTGIEWKKEMIPA